LGGKKILILASWYPSRASKIDGIFVQDQALVLARSYDVRVLAVRAVGWRDALKGGFGFCRPVERHSGVRVWRQPVFLLPMRFFHAWCWCAAYYGKKVFGKILADWGKPDVIHAHVVFPGGWLAVKLGQMYSIPVVLTEHSGPFSVHLRAESQTCAVKATLGHVNKLIAVSPAMADQIRDFDPKVEISIVGNVIMTDFFAPGRVKKRKPQQGMRFLCVALLDRNKGIGYLLKAVRLLVARSVHCLEVLIAGDGPERARLERLAYDLGISGYCRFLGLLQRKGVRYWMQSCDVLVLHSLGETFGVVLGEAMACGKPVIATRCGGPEFVVTPETGMLVERRNAIALAEAMEKFISGEVGFDSGAIRNCVVRRFGEKAFLENIEPIYRQVWKEH